MRFKVLKESGYHGYSMSNNAVAAYEDGEKPLSKWSRADILDIAKDINPSKYELIKKLPLSVLKELLLYKSSWHHTSSHYNRTDFYSFDEDKYNELTQEDIDNISPSVTVKETPIRHKGEIDYIEWAGSFKHPKAIKHHLDNVYIEEKGSFYVVYDENGSELVRKKRDSNGTYVRYYK